MIKVIIIVFIFLLLVSNVVNSEEFRSDEKNIQGSINSMAPAVQTKKNNSKERQVNESSQKKHWPSTFIPTEKINADSSVSFPVDI